MKQNKDLDSRVIIIDQSGHAYHIGSIVDEQSHGKTLMNYVEKKYPYATEFLDLNVDDNRELFAYRLGLYGDAVYYNIGNNGVIYLPYDVTDEQINTIYNLDLGNQFIELGYSPEYFGYSCYKAIGMGCELTLKEVMDEYINIKKNEELKTKK